MSAQLSSYWEPIDFRSEFPSVYVGNDDEDHPDRNRGRELIVDPEPQYSLVSTLLVVFVLVTGIFFATMSLAFLGVQTTVETLQLPHDHQVFSDLRRIENAATMVFAAVCLGFAVLAIGSRLYLSRKNSDAE